MSAQSKSASVLALDEAATEFTSQQIDDLRSRLAGQVILPGEPGYESSRAIWNGMIDRRPGFVVRCHGAADVAAGVRFAREHSLRLSIKGGGHNIAGLAVADGAMMLDMSPMKGVWVDIEGGRCVAQAGCLLGDVDRETQLYGQAAVLGFVSRTGIVGLTLGGGFGYMSRRFGWTSDNVISFKLVNARGELIRASESENSDLFWALRGGGGNFGVVTEIEYRVFPLGPEVMAGAIAWPAENAREVLEMYGKFMAQAPPELNCAMAIRLAPPAPWLPAEAHGKPIIALFPIYAGPVQVGRELLSPLKGFGSPLGDIIQPRPYLSQQSLLDATQPNGRRYYWKSEYLPGMSPELINKVIDHGERIVSPHSAVLLFPLDGALNTLPQSHSAVGNRDAKLVLNITASWDSPGDDDANISWARNAWSDMRNLSTGGTYINFLNEEEVGDRIRDAFGENYSRLVEAKAKWDPENFFRVNKNITP